MFDFHLLVHLHHFHSRMTVDQSPIPTIDICHQSSFLVIYEPQCLRSSLYFLICFHYSLTVCASNRLFTTIVDHLSSSNLKYNFHNVILGI